MKKFLCLVLSMAIISIGSISLAAGYYCPSESEYKAKEKPFLQRISNSSTSNTERLRILDEYDAYRLSVFKNCLGYIKTNPNPDCSKFSVSMLRNIATREQLYDILKYLDKCQYEQSVLNSFLKADYKMRIIVK